MAVDFELLIGSRSWSSTPWDYSSMRYLTFRTDGTGTAVHGYGQTLHATYGFEFQLMAGQRLRLRYTRSSSKWPELADLTEANRTKDCEIRLVEEPQEFCESVTGARFRFRARLELDVHPFPEGVPFPGEIPTAYYGYREPFGDP